MRVFLSRLKGLFGKHAAEQELTEELRTHVALLAERYVRQGMNAADAEAAATRQFGGRTQLEEELRERRSILLFENAVQDVRYAVRQLRKSPAFTITAALTLALGIGVNAAVFSVVYAVLLRPLPFKNAEQLVTVWQANPQRGWMHNVVSAANFNDWRAQNDVFSDMALVDPFITFNLTGGGEPVEITAEQVTHNLFQVLGVEPMLGRGFLPEEDRPGGARVAVIGHALWERRFGGDRSIIGKQISLNSENYTVVGVMPAGFSNVYSRIQDVNAQIWVTGLDVSNPVRTANEFIAIARLRRGVTLEKAQGEMNTIARRLERQYPDNRGWGVQVISLHDEVVGDSRPALLVLLAAVALVLLIACANLANLFLARGAAHARELAVRKALGANRRRLVAQILTQSLLLALSGALAGLWIAGLGTKGLIAIAPVDTPGIDTAGLHLPIILYTGGIALLTTVLFGLLPAFGMSDVDLSESLKESGRGASGGARRGRLRRLLVSVEFALALVLAVSAGLMVKTLVYMHHINVGFRPDHVLTLRVPLDDGKYNEQQQAQFFERLLRRLDALSGIESATVSRGIPFFGWEGQDYVTAENPHLAVADMPDANYVTVGPEYFNVLRIPLIKGRVFSQHDTDNALHVAVVNEALARKQWPGQDPIGKRLKVAWSKGPWLTVVGITGNVRTQGPEVDFLPEIYTPYLQHPWLLTPRNVLIRTRSENSLAALPAVRRAIHDLDPDQPISDVRTLEAVAGQPLALRHFLTYLLAGFAGFALLLAAIGVYGVMAYSVAQRLREIGIRMALGASQREVLTTVLKDGLRLAFLGIVAGVGGSLGAMRLLASQLYGVKATDPWTFAAVALALVTVAVVAAYVPAQRAARVDPVRVLRNE